MDMTVAFREVGTYRGAAAMCGCDPKTIKRELARQAGEDSAERKERARNYDVVVDVVGARVAKTAGRISAKGLLPEARAAGYTGSARNFRRLVATAKSDWRRDHHRGRRLSDAIHMAAVSRIRFGHVSGERLLRPHDRPGANRKEAIRALKRHSDTL
jgi:hypothetical protein